MLNVHKQKRGRAAWSSGDRIYKKKVISALSSGYLAVTFYEKNIKNHQKRPNKILSRVLCFQKLKIFIFGKVHLGVAGLPKGFEDQHLHFSL